MSSFTVREARPTDASFIQDLVGHAHAQGEPWASSWSAQMVMDEIKQAKTLIAVGPDDSPAGFVFVRPPGSDWEITLIAVDAQFKGKNIAGLLIGAISDLIQAAGSDAATAAILLEVREDNRSAIQAYEKNGFKAVGQRPRYYRDGASAILYKKG